MEPVKEISIRAGKWQDVYLRLGVDSRPDLVFDVRLSRPDSPGLALGIWDERSRRLVPRTTLPHTPGGRTLWLRVKAARSAARREYPAVLVITTAEDPVDGGKVRRARIPLRFTVRPAVFWTGRQAGRWLLALAATVLAFFAWTSFAHSRFLPLDRLAQRLQPLRWNERGETEPYQSSQAMVEGWLRSRLRWQDRASSWLRANPFLFGLPGRSYEETVQISLGRSLERLSVQPISRHDARSHLERHPDLQINRLFASALAGRRVKIFGRPDAGGRLGSLSQREGFERDRFDDLGGVELRDSPPRTDGPAGWRILPPRAAAGRRRVWAGLRWESGR